MLPLSLSCLPGLCNVNRKGVREKLSCTNRAQSSAGHVCCDGSHWGLAWGNAVVASHPALKAGAYGMFAYHLSVHRSPDVSI